VPARRPIFPYLALVFGIFALGISAIFVRWANAPGPVNGFYRMAIASTVMLLPVAAEARRTRPSSARHVALAMLAGLLFAADVAAWNTAVLLTTAATATLLANTSPLWVGLGALVLFREKLGPRFWLGLALGLAGATILLAGDRAAPGAWLGLGSVLGLVAGLFYGGFYLAAQAARERLSTLVAWWVSAATSAVALVLLSLALRQPLAGYSATTYVNLVAVALVTQVGGYVSINYALGHLPASIVSPTLLGQPVVTALVAVPLLGEPLTIATGLGGLLVVAGIALVHRQRRSREQ
jgi:drug/metabolite transporter (DMT)-like permease